MSGEAEGEEVCEKPFYVDRAKTGRAACKKCKVKIGVGDLRIGKLSYNPFGAGTMKLWHHVACMQEVFKKQRKGTKKIESSFDIGGWETISKEDKETIKSSLDWYLTPEQLKNFEVSPIAPEPTQNNNNDDSFRVFRKICSELTNESSYLGKTAIVKNLFTKGSDGNGFKGNIQLWCRSLLPMAAKRIYNLQSKQLVKIFSDIFHESQEEMLEDLEKGDVAETVGSFFERNSRRSPAKKAVLTLHEVEDFLVYLSKLTRETDQKDHFESILPKCTANDLKVIIRLIKHDLRINAGPKHILEALHADAYQAFQTSRDLEAVVKNATGSTSSTTTSPSSKEKGMNIGIKLMTPVRPMLAEACKSVEFAMKRCPKGMYSEIKYDGERVQLHKQGDEFKYFSRSLKAVTPHKVSHFAKYIPMAFQHGKDLILDSEILMMDTKTGEPLPFGTLGKHKKTAFEDATVCLFVFDCIYFNGKSLINETVKYRREILRENMTEIPNHVMFSEIKEIHGKEGLEDMIEEVLRKGLEGLVLKPLHSIYEPGKRHWLKVKKDYLFGGAMADTADLVVLGAWYGTGKKGGIMSVFLMGCYDTKRNSWVTVTKVHGGHDDKTLESLQTELKMVKISQNIAKVPSWLRCSKTMVPDFVAEDPKNSQVWEITGAEFTCNQVHTADGISIRFPRVTRIRKDKDWETATTLAELKKLYDTSKDTSGFTLKGRKTQKGDGSANTKPQNSRKKPVQKTKNKDSFIDDSGSETELDTEDDEEWSDEGSPAKKKALPNKKEATKRKGIQYETDTDDEDYAKKQKAVVKKEATKRKGIQYETDTDDEDYAKKQKAVVKKKADKVPPSSKKKRKDQVETDSDEVSSSEKRDRERRKEKPKDERKHTTEKKPGSSGIETEEDEDLGPSTSKGVKRKANGGCSLEYGGSSKARKAGTPSPSKKVKLDATSPKGKNDSKVKGADGQSDSRKGDGREKKTNILDSPKKQTLEDMEDSKNTKKSGDADSGSETEVDEEPFSNAFEKIEMENELPEVFTNLVVFLHHKVPDLEKARRYVIAYGGAIYSEEKTTTLENNKRKVTHVVYPRRTIDKKVELKNRVDRLKSVGVEWLWDSVKKSRRQDEHRYKVKES